MTANQLQPPVLPMLAAAPALPSRPGWAYEPKFDGWRAIAVIRRASVFLQSRSGKALSPYFPNPQEFDQPGDPRLR